MPGILSISQVKCVYVYRNILASLYTLCKQENVDIWQSAIHCVPFYRKIYIFIFINQNYITTCLMRSDSGQLNMLPLSVPTNAHCSSPYVITFVSKEYPVKSMIPIDLIYLTFLRILFLCNSLLQQYIIIFCIYISIYLPIYIF